jgi:proteasome beta subunit
MENELMKTGTTTVGILCKDGVVLAADKRATSGYLVASKKAEKIHQIADRMAVTLAGTVSDAQFLVKLIRAELTLKNVRTNRQSNVKEAANLLGGLVYNNIRKLSMIPGISHFLLAGVDDEGYSLYDLFADGSVTQIDDFVSSGSGSVMAYGVLDTLYKKDLTVDEGVKLALKCINAALSRDIATGNGIDVLTITKDGIKRVMDKELSMKIEA